MDIEELSPNAAQLPACPTDDIVVDSKKGYLNFLLPMTLNLVELERTAWWQFWKRAPATRPLSTHASAVPQAELALLEALLQKSTRREKPLARDAADHAPDRSHNSGRSASSTSAGPEAFAGKGGQSGGGASGRWVDTPTASGILRSRPQSKTNNQ